MSVWLELLNQFKRPLFPKEARRIGMRPVLAELSYAPKF